MLYNQKDTENYAGVIEKLYERVLSSEDTNTKNSALSLLISKYMNRKEYDKAEELLSMLPDENAVDKLQLKANLHIAKGELNDAASKRAKALIRHNRNPCCFNDTHGNFHQRKPNRRCRIYCRHF